MCACAAPMILTFLEDGQHGIPTPFRIAAELCPLVIVARLATHVDHAVDRRRAAENPPARIQDRAPAEPGFDLRLIAPIGAWIADAIKIADWNMNPDPVVLAAGFEQQHQHVGICRQIGRAHVELQSLMRISYAVFCLKKKTTQQYHIQSLLSSTQPDLYNNIIT